VGGCVPPPRNAGRAAPAGAPRAWSGLLSLCDVVKGELEETGDRV